jgi:hypothetical protein
LQSAVAVRGSRIAVIDECHAVSDENAVLDRYPFADEGVTRYLAALPDFCALLDLDERPDLCFIADLATVEIDEAVDPTLRPSLTSGAIH